MLPDDVDERSVKTVSEPWHWPEWLNIAVGATNTGTGSVVSF
jgi:hypothetical protein